MKTKFDEKKAKDALNNGAREAEETLKDEAKTSKLIASLEKKLENSKLGEMLETIPLFISCLKSYIKREYTEIPVGSMVAIVSALIYWLSPIDIIPDTIPGIGHIDDAAVVLACLQMVRSDLDDYKKWFDEKEAQLQYFDTRKAIGTADFLLCQLLFY